MRKLLLAVVLLILYASFYPWHFAHIPGQPFLIPVSLSDTRDLILNFWVYVPVGALAAWVFAPAGVLRWIIALCLGLALSTFVELVQYFIPTRISSLGDIFANTLGTLGGMLLAAWIGSAPPLSRWEMRRSPEAALLLLWTGLLLFPLIPVHGLYALRGNLRAFLENPWSWSSLVVWTIAWVVVWELIPGAFVRGTNWIVFGWLVLLLPARLFLILRVLTKAEAAAGLLALCWAIVMRRTRVAPFLLAGLILTALAIRGLTPLEFAAFPSPFNWIPLAGLLNSQWQPAMLVLITKTFWYAAAVWALARSGLGLSWAGALLAVFLAGIEIVQRYMPAHVPEITDPLLALFCAAALWVVRNPVGQAKPHPFLMVR